MFKRSTRSFSPIHSRQSCMAPLPIATTTQNVVSTATYHSVSSTIPPHVHKPPGRPVLLAFTLLVFMLVCSAYFIYRYICLKNLGKSILSPDKESPAASARSASPMVVATPPSKLLWSFSTMDFQLTSNGNTLSMLELDHVSTSTAKTAIPGAEFNDLTNTSSDIWVSAIAECIGLNLTAISVQSEQTASTETRPPATRISSAIRRLWVLLREISATVRSPLAISASHSSSVREPGCHVATSINIREHHNHCRLSCATEFTTYAKVNDFRRHSISGIRVGDEGALSRGSLEPFRHVRSITAPSIILLSSLTKTGPSKNVVQ